MKRKIIAIYEKHEKLMIEGRTIVRLTKSILFEAGEPVYDLPAQPQIEHKPADYKQERHDIWGFCSACLILSFFVGTFKYLF